MHCPGCGFGFWYALGALETIRPSGQLTAVSGGALAAACYLCGLDSDVQLEACDRLRTDMITSWDLNGTIRTWLRSQLPEDCVERVRGRLVVLVRRFPLLSVKRYDSWRSKNHLVDTLVAAASPLWPLQVDGEWVIDCYDAAATPNDDVLPLKSCWYVPTFEQARNMVHDARTDFGAHTQKKSGTWTTTTRMI